MTYGVRGQTWASVVPTPSTRIGEATSGVGIFGNSKEAPQSPLRVTGASGCLPTALGGEGVFLGCGALYLWDSYEAPGRALFRLSCSQSLEPPHQLNLVGR